MNSSVISLGNISTGASVTNTTAETILHSLSIPAFLLGNSRGLRFSLVGSIVGTSTANPTTIFRTRISASTSIGSLVMATSSISLSNSTSARNWKLEGGTISTTTDAQSHWLALDIGTPGAVAPTTVSILGQGNSTQNYDGSLNLRVTVQMSSASTEFTVNTEVGNLEMVR